jgi:hypothetical protein
MKQKPPVPVAADWMSPFTAPGHLVKFNADVMTKDQRRRLITETPDRGIASTLFLDVTNAEDLVDIGAKHLAGTRKQRSCRMPALNKWLASKDLNMTNDSLWACFPDSDDTDADLYRDGDELIEIKKNGKEHSISRGAFDKRITAARKIRR